MNDVEVAIVGAGPYGLSLASHLRAAGVSFRQFGQLMNPWGTAMPQGMFLKSQGFASNLSDPRGTHTLEAFCAATGRPYASYGLPVPLDTFVAYGEWFQAELLPDLEQTLVTAVSRRDTGYQLDLATGETISARQVVVAAGIEHFPFAPVELAGLPEEICTTAAGTPIWRVARPERHRAGRRPVRAGVGGAAARAGAAVRSSCARRRWPGTAPRSTLSAHCSSAARTRAGLGSGWGTWFYSNHLASSGTCRPPPVSAGPDGARAGRGELAPRPGGRRVPDPHRAEPALGAARSLRSRDRFPADRAVSVN